LSHSFIPPQSNNITVTRSMRENLMMPTLLPNKSTPSAAAKRGFIQHLPEYPAACCGDEWLNIAFLRGAIPRQEGAGFI